MVVLALNYWQGESIHSPLEGSDCHGVIARYARGDDYHAIIEDRLSDLCAVLEEIGGIQQRGYVDYGPVLERDFASASGIGWNGKSTVQIHPKLGTWFFLAEVLTTLELPVDSPSNDHCGKCTRCIDACPTNAICSDEQPSLVNVSIKHRFMPACLASKRTVSGATHRAASASA